MLGVSRPEFYTSLNADGGGENNWISTAADPAAAPNTGKFFCPSLHIAFRNEGFGAAEDTIMDLYVEEEIILEVRGSKK